MELLEKLNWRYATKAMNGCTPCCTQCSDNTGWWWLLSYGVVNVEGPNLPSEEHIKCCNFPCMPSRRVPACSLAKLANRIGSFRPTQLTSQLLLIIKTVVPTHGRSRHRWAAPRQAQESANIKCLLLSIKRPCVMRTESNAFEHGLPRTPNGVDRSVRGLKCLRSRHTPSLGSHLSRTSPSFLPSLFEPYLPET